MDKTKIEWCDSTWNPISGCFHGCEYCYARNTAERFAAKGAGKMPDGLVVLERPVKSKKGKGPTEPYPNGFHPTYYRYKLEQPKKWKEPRTIFVCSMADMFGRWVPDEVIDEIFAVCKGSPQHKYLFLTKNPARYMELGKAGKLPELDNFWYGSTMTGPDKPVFYSANHNTFISVEPILEPFGEARGGRLFSEHINWLILGAETGLRKDKVVPEKSWVKPLVDEFKASGKPVFMKDSMKPVWGDDIYTEFPWETGV